EDRENGSRGYRENGTEKTERTDLTGGTEQQRNQFLISVSLRLLLNPFARCPLFPFSPWPPRSRASRSTRFRVRMSRRRRGRQDPGARPSPSCREGSRQAATSAGRRRSRRR